MDETIRLKEIINDLQEQLHYSTLLNEQFAEIKTE